MEGKRRWFGWIAIGLGALALLVALLGRGFGSQFAAAGRPGANAAQSYAQPGTGPQGAGPQSAPGASAQPGVGPQHGMGAQGAGPQDSVAPQGRMGPQGAEVRLTRRERLEVVEPAVPEEEGRLLDSERLGKGFAEQVRERFQRRRLQHLVGQPPQGGGARGASAGSGCLDGLWAR